MCFLSFSQWHQQCYSTPCTDPNSQNVLHHKTRSRYPGENRMHFYESQAKQTCTRCMAPCALQWCVHNNTVGKACREKIPLEPVMCTVKWGRSLLPFHIDSERCIDDDQCIWCIHACTYVHTCGKGLLCLNLPYDIITVCESRTLDHRLLKRIAGF